MHLTQTRLMKLGVAVVIGASPLALGACGQSFSASQQQAANKALAFVKKTVTQNNPRPWVVTSVTGGTYGALSKSATSTQRHLEVFEVTISGSTEVPICPLNATPGTKCKEKLIPAVDHVFVSQKGEDVLAVESTDRVSSK
jgi:hypothetical protein